MSRRFGPTLGPGTVIIEKEAGKSIQPAPTGTTVFVGQTEKGVTSDLLSCVTQREFIANCGTYLDDSELPNAAFDLFNLSSGAASLYVVRVTDGNEISSDLNLYNRLPGTGEYVDRAAGDFRKNLLMEISAKSGGRWGGAARSRSGSFTIVADLGETTLDVDKSMMEDEFVGATLTLEGVSDRAYTVTANDTAGVLTVTSDSTMSTDLAGGGDSANNGYHLVLGTETRQYTAPGQVAGDRRAVSCVAKNAEDTDGNYFGLEVYADGSLVKDFKNLSLDPASKYYAETVINEDPDNPYISVSVPFTGSASLSANRPANFCGEYNDDGTSVIDTFPVCFPKLVSSDADNVGFITNFVVPAKCRKMKLTVELTGAAAFKVYVDSGEAGMQIEDGELNTGTVGTQWTPDAGAEFIPAFTVGDGIDSYVAGDKFEVVVDPFPVDVEDGSGLMANWWFHPEKDGLIRYAIEDNTPNQLTLKQSIESAPTPNGKPADILDIGSGLSGFPTPASNPTCDLILGGCLENVGTTNITVAGAVGPHADIGALVGAMNAQWTALGYSGTPFTNDGDKLQFDADAVNFDYLGADAFAQLVTSSVGGIGVSGAAGNPVVSGSRGDQWLIQAPSELEGGYDGSDPADADYTGAFNTVTSLINRLEGRNLGLAKIACPGVTSTAIQKAGLGYAAARNYQYRIEIPSNTTSETSAVDYINSTIGRSDYGVVSWPSYGYVVNPLGEGLILQTLTGAIQGREAAMARDYSGYHKAAAGVGVTIPNMIKDVLDGAPLNEELLNPNGVGMIKKMKGNFVVWGDRTISLDPGWKWKHQREQMSHYEHQLQENFDWLIFMINDPTTQAIVATTLRAFFLPEWQKRALRGGDFEDACSIKIDSENNTDATMSAGDLNADISLRLADTVERFIITIGKKGIFDQAG